MVWLNGNLAGAAARTRGRPACALLVVSEHRGSSPGRRGMLMAVGRHNPLAGTIGGGQAETTLVAAAQAALQAENLQPWARR